MGLRKLRAGRGEEGGGGEGGEGEKKGHRSRTRIMHRHISQKCARHVYSVFRGSIRQHKQLSQRSQLAVHARQSFARYVNQRLCIRHCVLYDPLSKWDRDFIFEINHVVRCRPHVHNMRSQMLRKRRKQIRQQTLAASLQ